MRAERDRRAAILNAEGIKQSQILTAEGDKQSAILRAEGQAQAAVLQAQGEARAIQQVFEAIHRGDPDPKLLAYQYLQILPKIARGESNKLWIVPSELGEALKGIGGMLGGVAPAAGRAAPPDGALPEAHPRPAGGPGQQEGAGPDLGVHLAETVLPDPSAALAEAQREAAGARDAAEDATREGSVTRGREPR
jgi:hypothetical protein